jgi:hypothetical protein
MNFYNVEIPFTPHFITFAIYEEVLQVEISVLLPALFK